MNLSEMLACETYDHLFRANAERWGCDWITWLHLKAQDMAESGLNPLAVSPAGAQGLAQIMPSTATWLTKLLGNQEGVGRAKTARLRVAFAPADAIELQALYMAWLAGLSSVRSPFKGFADIPWPARWDCALAGYNAGQGNIAKARKRARRAGADSTSWSAVRGFLYDITGPANAGQTIEYVKRCRRYYYLLAAHHGDHVVVHPGKDVARPGRGAERSGRGE